MKTLDYTANSDEIFNFMFREWNGTEVDDAIVRYIEELKKNPEVFESTLKKLRKAMRNSKQNNI